ncbi:hypothetical protein BDB00DRAFT_943166 [Zychaea mexicana]|uniref:uncharacterized protein n=1 Tax=Zychaea mexicana TaxID=64656 RepID=UPI0022FE81FD|nr:uncharacterized protein BDB00DRAFT_943166 [Zychaea mexicana]KAI9484352.1 hypothetical protein BDB00DRAFT_943166 [Zychaea mexicana]
MFDYDAVTGALPPTAKTIVSTFKTRFHSFVARSHVRYDGNPESSWILDLTCKDLSHRRLSGEAFDEGELGTTAKDLRRGAPVSKVAVFGRNAHVWWYMLRESNEILTPGGAFPGSTFEDCNVNGRLKQITCSGISVMSPGFSDKERRVPLQSYRYMYGRKLQILVL